MKKVDIQMLENKEVTPLNIAHFLFMIGFINAVEKKPGNHRENIYRYTQKPYLLDSLSNLDEGLKWRIHPAYCGTLHIYG